jgi:hypothetical protein
MAEMRAIDPKLLKAMKYEEMRVQFRVSRDVFCPRAKPSWMKNSFLRFPAFPALTWGDAGNADFHHISIYYDVDHQPRILTPDGW